MVSGTSLAINEITLVVFTTFTPSGVLAAAALCAYALWLRSLRSDEASRLLNYLSVPIVLSMVGFVASATHLGNPANVLYVFARTGFSPLSNEVAFAVVFLGLVGSFWLYSFSARIDEKVERIWIYCILVSAVLFLAAMSFAYSAATVISWSTPYAPILMWANALLGGPLVFLVTADLALSGASAGRMRRMLSYVALFGLIAGAVVLALQNHFVSGLANQLLEMGQLVPSFVAPIVLYLVFGFAGVLVLWFYRDASTRKAALLSGISASAFVFLAIFVTRFQFYAMHMTVGLGA